MIALPPRSTSCSGFATRSGWASSSGGNCRRAHERASSQYEASALERVVATRDLQHLLHRRPRGDVDVLGRIVKRLTRERHPVLPTDEPTDARCAGVRGHVHGMNTVPVTLAPHETLGVRRDKLAMVIEQRAVGSEGQQRVEQRAATRPSVHAFDDADDHRDAVSARDRAELVSRRAIDDDTLLGHAPKDGFDRRMIPEAGIAADVEPRRIAGEPGLREGDERRSGARGVCGTCVRQLEPLFEARSNFILHDRNANDGWGGGHAQNLALCDLCREPGSVRLPTVAGTFVSYRHSIGSGASSHIECR